MQHSDFIYIYLKNKFADGYFSEKNYTQVSCLLNQFDLQSIVQSIDIAYKNYYLKSLNNNDSLPDHDFIVKKISGILYNNSLPPIEKEKRHTLNYVKKFRTDWDVSCTNNFLSAITNYFKDNCYNSESILTEFNFIRKLIFENDTLNQWIECVVDHIAEH